MSPQLEPVLESQLAAILMGELLRPREDVDDTYVDIILDDLDLDETDDYYASFELVRESVPGSVVALTAAATTEFVRVRDTSRDHVTTKKYPRASLDPDTLPTPKYSAPYELIDIEHPPIAAPAAQFTSYPHAKFPLNSAPYERIDLQDYSHPFMKASPTDWSAESTEVLAPPQTASRVIATIVVLIGALLLGLSIVVYGMSS